MNLFQFIFIGIITIYNSVISKAITTSLDFIIFFKFFPSWIRNLIKELKFNLTEVSW